MECSDVDFLLAPPCGNQLVFVVLHRCEKFSRASVFGRRFKMNVVQNELQYYIYFSLHLCVLCTNHTDASEAAG